MLPPVALETLENKEFDKGRKRWCAKNKQTEEYATNWILVESRSWRDRNLKFGSNCDLEVDNLEKN